MVSEQEMSGVDAQLRVGEVQVWRIDLVGGAFSRQEMRGLLDRAYGALTAEERARAARMRVGTAREEFVAGRGCLRRLLAAELGADARMLVFATGEQGKPWLRDGEGTEFNVSHSRGMVLIALSRAGAVGVDVEGLDAGVELMDVARTAFHVEDLARIGRADLQEERLREFYRCWTRREAVGKVDGRGLTIPAEDFCVGGDGERRVLLDGREYCVQGVDVGSRHMAAVATVASGVKARVLEVTPRSLVLFAD